MARIPSEADLTFSTTDGLTYRRKLFGSESVFAYESQNSGQFFAYVGISVVLPRSLFEEDVRRRVIIAWIRLRHTVPDIGMGCNASIHDPRDFSFEYQVPRNTAEAEEWAKNTIVWETCQTTFLERQNQMNNEFWDATSGVCMSRLVVGRRSDTEYDLFLHAMHAASDGRKSLQLLDLFLKHLDDVLRSSNPTGMLEELNWGEEVARLAPAAALLAARIVNEMSGVGAVGAEPAGEPTLFKKASPENPMDESAYICHSQDITLSEIDTNRLRAACQRQKVSVTGFLLAAMCLSEVEQSLGSPGKIEKAALLNSKQYKDSSVHYQLVNAYDVRGYFGPYSNHGPVGTPTVAIKVASTFVPMKLIQGALLFDESSFSIIRSGPGFWRLAEYTKEQVQIEARTGIRGFLASECRTDSSIRGEAFVPWSEAMSGSTLTSIGDLRLLGPLHRWWTDSVDGEHLRVQDIGISSRTLRAMKGHMSWQFKGRLTIRVRTGGKWTTSGQLDEYNKVFRSWIDDILQDGWTRSAL